MNSDHVTELGFELLVTLSCSNVNVRELDHLAIAAAASHKGAHQKEAQE
jgi:hypothetical protein